jgi:hypothetical protein
LSVIVAKSGKFTLLETEKADERSVALLGADRNFSVKKLWNIFQTIATYTSSLKQSVSQSRRAVRASLSRISSSTPSFAAFSADRLVFWTGYTPCKQKMRITLKSIREKLSRNGGHGPILPEACDGRVIHRKKVIKDGGIRFVLEHTRLYPRMSHSRAVKGRQAHQQNCRRKRPSISASPTQTRLQIAYDVPGADARRVWRKVPQKGDFFEIIRNLPQPLQHT